METDVEDKDEANKSNSHGLVKTLRAGRQQTKVVKTSVENVEYHYPQFIQDINVYTVRSAKLRDAGDNFSRSLLKYAALESPVLQNGLTEFAEGFALVQDHRNVLVDRLEHKVAEPLAAYEERCIKVKQEAGIPYVALKKEVHQHRLYQNARKRSISGDRLQKVETNYRRASDETVQSRNSLFEQLYEFEREKVRDLKHVLGELLLSEMSFFTRALELYTLSYQQLMKMDEDDTIEHLQHSLNNTSYGISEMEFHPSTTTNEAKEEDT